MSRICISGGPRCGKTTLASTLYLPTRHTDDVIDAGWSEASALVSSWFDEPGPWCIEGVATIRALRKWLDTHRQGSPCDVLVFLQRPHMRLNPGQETMLKGTRTVFWEVKRELVRRGVDVRFDLPQRLMVLSGSL